MPEPSVTFSIPVTLHALWREAMERYPERAKERGLPSGEQITRAYFSQRMLLGG